MTSSNTLAQIAGTLANLAETLKAELIASERPSDRISKLEKELYEAEEERNAYRERWQEAADELALAKAMREHFKEMLDRSRAALVDALERDHRARKAAWTGTEEDAVLLELEKLREQRAAALAKVEEMLQHRTRYAISDTTFQPLNELYHSLLPSPRNVKKETE
jgi:chromosome segregation ATPase